MFCNIFVRLRQNADFSRSPCFPSRPRLLCPPEQTQPDQGPTPGPEPEQELAQHEVFHGQPGRRPRVEASKGYLPLPRMPSPRSATLGSALVSALSYIDHVADYMH